MELTELQSNLRKNIIEALELFESREEQLEYQRRVPIAHVTDELFCIWGNDSYDESFIQDEDFCSIFSEPEWKVMADFNEIYKRVLRSMPDSGFPPIEEFVLTPESAKLAEAATVALSALRGNASENNCCKHVISTEPTMTFEADY